MTLVMTESCTDSPAQVAQVKPWYQVNFASVSTGRDGANTGWATTSGANNKPQILLSSGDHHATMTCGFAIKPGPIDGVTFFSFYAPHTTTPGATGGIVHLRYKTIAGQPGYGVEVVRAKDSVVLGTSTLGVLESSNFYFVEVKLVVHASAGSVEVRVNEVAHVSVTGADTTPSATYTATCCGVIWNFGGNSSLQWVMDDVYLCNGAGSTNTGFLGDVSVVRLFPTAAGDSTQFAPSDLTMANWKVVDDYSPTDYDFAILVGDTDLYNFGDIPSGLSGSTVFGVLSWMGCYTSALPRGVSMVTKLSGTESESATITLSTTTTGYDVAGFRHTLETKPGGGSWSTSDVNSAQHGVRVKT